MPPIGRHQIQTATFRFDAATAGGVGAHTLAGHGVNGNDVKIPDNAQILRAWLEPVTDLASAGSATVKVGITGNDDALIAATAFNNTVFDAPDKVTALTAEVPLKVNATGGVEVLATVAVAAVTAGVFDVHVEFLPGS